MTKNEPAPPEPPMRFDPNALPESMPDGGGKRAPQNAELESAKRLATVAQIAAFVSLVIGGVILSSAAIALAIVAFARTRSLADGGRDAQYVAALKRSAIIAIAVSITALALNVVSLIYLYPIVMDALQSESLDMTAPSVSSSGNSTWG